MTQCAPPPPCDLDEEYFWDFVTFSAQGRLFRVPKYKLFNDSEYFANKYCHRDNGSESEYSTVGSEDPQLNAVKLDDVSASDFRAFLKAIYPKVTRGNLALSRDEWLSVLKLTTKWFFNDLRKEAIEVLSYLDLDPTEKIQLGKEHNIESWLLSGCRELITRESVISIEDAEKIHWTVALNLYIIRDGVKTEPTPEDAIDSQVRRAFAADFEQIETSQAAYLTPEDRVRIAQEKRRKLEEDRQKEEAEDRAAYLEACLEALAADEERELALGLVELPPTRSPSLKKKKKKTNKRATSDEGVPSERMSGSGDSLSQVGVATGSTRSYVASFWD